MINTTFKKLILGLVALLFLLSQPLPIFAQMYSITINESRGKSVVKVKDGKNNFKAEYSGEISLTEDDTDILAISDNGYIEITKSTFGKKRKVRVEADRKGQLIRKYYIGRKEQVYVPEGEKWLREILPQVAKNTSIGAFSRVDKLYCKGGAEAVLDDIVDKESDYVKIEYLNLLLNRELTVDELDETIILAGKTIESDHYLTDLLQENQRKILASPNGISSYVTAAKSIESDHYKVDVLSRIVDDSAVPDASMLAILDILGEMDSDHYLSEILTDILDERTCTPETVQAIIRLTSTMDSDHYKTEVYSEAMSQKRLDAESIGLLLQGMRKVGSDHYYTEVINDLCNQRKIEDATLAVVVENVFSDVGSDHYKTEIFDDLLNAFDFESAAIDRLCQGLRRDMESDHYLVEIVDDIIDTQKLSDQDLTKLIYAMDGMKSDSYLSDALLELADEVDRRGGEVLEAYKDVASGIKSDHYYREAMDIESLNTRSHNRVRAPEAPQPPAKPEAPQSPSKPKAPKKPRNIKQ